MIIDLDYIKAGIKAIKDTNVNINKMCRDFSIAPKIIYSGITEHTSAETLSKLMRVIKYCEKNNLIDLNAFGYVNKQQEQYRNQIELNTLLNKINKRYKK